MKPGLLLWTALALWSVGVVARAEEPLDLKCEHSYIPERDEVVLYSTIHNHSSQEVRILTFLPNSGASIHGGIWLFVLQASTYADTVPGRPIANRDRLLPRTLKKDETVVLTHRMTIYSGKLGAVKFDSKTHVEVLYKISDADAARYGTWNGTLTTRSSFVPFYETDK